MSPASWFRDTPNIHNGRLHRRGSLALHTSPWPPADPPTGTLGNGKKKKGGDSTARSIAGCVEQLPELFETLSLGRRGDTVADEDEHIFDMGSRSPDSMGSTPSSSNDVASGRYPLRSRAQNPYSDWSNNDDDDESAPPETHCSPPPPLNPSPPRPSTKSLHTNPSHHPAQNINMTVNLTLPSSTTSSSIPHPGAVSSPASAPSHPQNPHSTSRSPTSPSFEPSQRTHSYYPAGNNIHIFTGRRRGGDTREEINHLRASRAAITDQLERATKLNREMRERFADTVVPGAAVPSGVAQTASLGLEHGKGGRSWCGRVVGVAGSIVSVLVLLFSLCYVYDCVTSPAAQYARRRECLEFGLEADC